MAQQPPVGQCLLIIEDSRSHSDKRHLLGLLWTSDQPDAENSDNTQQSQQIDIHAPGGIQTHNPSNPVAADPRLRPRGHWDRQNCNISVIKINILTNTTTSLIISGFLIQLHILSQNFVSLVL
jgi:hypothetical protein